jgi:hypothetical protein
MLKLNGDCVKDKMMIKCRGAEPRVDGRNRSRWRESIPNWGGYHICGQRLAVGDIYQMVSLCTLSLFANLPFSLLMQALYTACFP